MEDCKSRVWCYAKHFVNSYVVNCGIGNCEEKHHFVCCVWVEIDKTELCVRGVTYIHFSMSS